MANMAKSYIHEIPEGYEARIEGNKVIIELAESEDERNWKIVMEYVKDDALRDWLEKLKESLHISETCKENADSFTDEDERIRKEIILFLDGHLGTKNTPTATPSQINDWIGYLESEGNQGPKEYMDNRVQYASIIDGIKAHATTYSFNFESKLGPQLTKEQQEVWREEIEQAAISGGEVGIELARDMRYKENKTVECSEDERIRKWLFNLFDSRHSNFVEELDNYNGNVTRKEILAWLEKQKESTWTEEDEAKVKTMCEEGDLKPSERAWLRNLKNRISKESLHISETCKEKPDSFIDSVIEVRSFQRGLAEGRRQEQEKQKKQKPASTEDMPYITDEHFYEREPVDSFKYKLAEYMTRGCTKKEGPYGYEYGISAETILEMAKEELLKRGVVQKPAEWSNEDEEALREVKLNFELNHEDMTPALVACYERFFKKVKEIRPQAKQEWDDDDYVCFSEIVSLIGQHYRGENIERGNELINWLKGYEPQPSWNPSEEQIHAIVEALKYLPNNKDEWRILNTLVDVFKRLM